MLSHAIGLSRATVNNMRQNIYFAILVAVLLLAGDKGEKLYVIHAGKVKITRFTDSGKEQVIR